MGIGVDKVMIVTVGLVSVRDEQGYITAHTPALP